MYDMRREHFQMLVDSGVQLLMGTDSGGYQDHGTIGGEIDLWLQWGAPREFTIDAATWVSQALPRLPRPRRRRGAPTS